MPTVVPSSTASRPPPGERQECAPVTGSGTLKPKVGFWIGDERSDRCRTGLELPEYVELCRRLVCSDAIPEKVRVGEDCCIEDRLCKNILFNLKKILVDWGYGKFEVWVDTSGFNIYLQNEWIGGVKEDDSRFNFEY